MLCVLAFCFGGMASCMWHCVYGVVSTALCAGWYCTVDSLTAMLVPRATNDKRFIRDAARQALGLLTSSGFLSRSIEFAL